MWRGRAMMAERGSAMEPTDLPEPAASAGQGDRLEYLIARLRDERPELAGLQTPVSVPERFELFRSLVNVRQPIPADAAFLRTQDSLLQQVIAEAGITEADDLPTCERDGRLALWQGDITTLRVDAIVNATNSALLGCFIPGHHCIDNAIHTFAGVQLRAECDRIVRQRGHAEPTGDATITPAFNLPADYVIHTVGPIVEDKPDARQALQLESCYRSCLDEAARAECASVAFCCISTGEFRFPRKPAAKLAVRTVRRWLDASPEAGVKRVVFDVLLDEDAQAYQEEMAAL